MLTFPALHIPIAKRKIGRLSTIGDVEMTSKALCEVSLDDKYTATAGAILLTGTQALVRLPLDQRRADRRAGLSTAGYISGYRGSPIGGYDSALWRAEK